MSTNTSTTPSISGGDSSPDAPRPYAVEIQICGASDLLFNKWNINGTAGQASRNDFESSVHRCPDGTLAIPGDYLRQAIIGAARYQKDQRSPLENAVEIYKAGIAVVTELASLGSRDWDCLDRRRVRSLGRSGAETRTRPAMFPGWRATFILEVLLPEYIRPDDLRSAIEDAGRFIGIGDFRPHFGRFTLTKFEVLPPRMSPSLKFSNLM